jgi:hypothetical protein
MLPDRNSAGVHGVRPVVPQLSQQQVQQLIDRRQLSLIVEAAEIFVVTEAPLDLRWPEPRLEWLVRRGISKQSGEGFGPGAASAHDRPLADQAAEDCRLVPGGDLALEALPIHRLMFGDRLHGLRLAAQPSVR